MKRGILNFLILEGWMLTNGLDGSSTLEQCSGYQSGSSSSSYRESFWLSLRGKYNKSLIFTPLYFFRLLTLGHDFKKGPIPTGCRKKIVNFLYRINGKIWMLVCGVFVTHTDKKEYDFSYYLGPGYKEKYKPIKKCSTIISNHVSWIDTQNIY